MRWGNKKSRFIFFDELVASLDCIQTRATSKPKNNIYIVLRALLLLEFESRKVILPLFRVKITFFWPFFYPPGSFISRKMGGFFPPAGQENIPFLRPPGERIAKAAKR